MLCTEAIGVIMICLHTKFHMPNMSGSLVFANKSETI